MTCISSVIVLSGIAAIRHADQPPAKAVSPAERLAQIQKAHKEAETEFCKAAEALKDTPEGRKQYTEMWKAYDKGQGERFPAAVEFARKALPARPPSGWNVRGWPTI